MILCGAQTICHYDYSQPTWIISSDYTDQLDDPFKVIQR